MFDGICTFTKIHCLDEANGYINMLDTDQGLY